MITLTHNDDKMKTFAKVAKIVNGLERPESINAENWSALTNSMTLSFTNFAEICAKLATTYCNECEIEFDFEFYGYSVYGAAPLELDVEVHGRKVSLKYYKGQFDEVLVGDDETDVTDYVNSVFASVLGAVLELDESKGEYHNEYTREDYGADQYDVERDWAGCYE